MNLFSRQKSQNGTSLMEMAIVIAIMGFVIAGVTRFIGHSKTNLIDFENQTELIRRTLRTSDNVRESVKTADLILANYISGATTTVFNYKAIIDAAIDTSPSNAPKRVAFNRAPTVYTTGGMTIESFDAQPYIGNEIQYAASVGSFDILVYPNGTDAEEVKISLIQFVSVYLAGVPPARIGPLSNSKLAVVEWRSLPVVHMESLNYLPSGPGSKLEMVIDVLTNPPWNFVYAWTDELPAAANVATAFYLLSDDTLGTLDATPVLTERSWAFVSEFSRAQDYMRDKSRISLPQGHISYAGLGSGVSGFKSSYSVAYNNQTPTASPNALGRLMSTNLALKVPKFARPDAPDAVTEDLPGFPGGFEVFVAGLPTAREVWVRTTMFAASAANERYGPLGFPAADALTVATVNQAN